MTLAFSRGPAVTRKDHFERFEDHTRLKHFLLDNYLKQWATILAPRFPRFWFVDAFAGAGRDSTGAPGSPLLAAEVARTIAAEHFRAPLGTPLAPNQGLRVVAIEADAARATHLDTAMAPYTQEAPQVAHVHHGTLSAVLDDLGRFVGKEPALYFLDPFGVDGLEAALVRRLLETPHAELLVLFSDEGAVRLAGKADARVPSREALEAERERDPSLFGEEWDAQLAAADRQAVDRVLAGHKSNPRAESILTRAFGGDAWRSMVDTTPEDERRERFVALYDALLREVGATHVLRFRVTTEAGRHKYTLLHASKHVRAFAAMKDAMHRAWRKREGSSMAEATPSLFDVADAEPGVGTADTTSQRDAAQLDSGAARDASDIDATVSALRAQFAGDTVRWTSTHYSDRTVQSFARDFSPLLLHQFPALQAALQRAGFQTRKRPAEYSFPPSDG